MAGEVAVVEAGECAGGLAAASSSMVRGAVNWSASVVGERRHGGKLVVVGRSWQPEREE